MKIEERDELLEAIAALSEQFPDWRLGQLVSNVAGWADQDDWDVEDERLLEAARTHLHQSKSSAATPAVQAERCR